MKTLFNRILFDQVNLDSAALTMKSSVVRIFNAPGEYLGQVSRNNQAVGNFRLLVNENYPDKQVAIDLKAVEQQQAKSNFMLSLKGYCVFYVSDGAGGYTVSLIPAGEKSNVQPFDSSTLQDGDIFTASIIRPGYYTATNRKNNTGMEIVVPYPRRADKKPVLKPVTIECTVRGFNPGKLEIQPGCGMIFSIKVASQITIELKKPVDRPEIFKTPEDIPRRIERKALAVLNSAGESKFLSNYIDLGKGNEFNQSFSDKIFALKQKTGRIDNIRQLFDLEKLEPQDYTKMIESLYNAFGKLTEHSRLNNSH